MDNTEIIDHLWAKYHGQIDNIASGEASGQMEAFSKLLIEAAILLKIQ